MPEANEPIVVNTSPLIALESCGRVDLLRALHARVIIPHAVLEEFELGRLDVKPCFEAMRTYGIWLSGRLIASALREADEE